MEGSVPLVVRRQHSSRRPAACCALIISARCHGVSQVSPVCQSCQSVSGLLLPACCLACCLVCCVLCQAAVWSLLRPAWWVPPLCIPTPPDITCRAVTARRNQLNARPVKRICWARRHWAGTPDELPEGILSQGPLAEGLRSRELRGGEHSAAATTPVCLCAPNPPLMCVCVQAAGAVAQRLGTWEETEDILSEIPALALRQSARKCGYLEREGTKMGAGLASIVSAVEGVAAGGSPAGSKGLDGVSKRKWFVLWRHPDVTRDPHTGLPAPYYLFCYDSETSEHPNEFRELERGKVTIQNEKGRRRVSNFAFSVQVAYEDEATYKVSMNAETFAEKVSWMNALDEHTQVRRESARCGPLAYRGWPAVCACGSQRVRAARRPRLTSKVRTSSCTKTCPRLCTLASSSSQRASCSAVPPRRATSTSRVRTSGGPSRSAGSCCGAIRPPPRGPRRTPTPCSGTISIT
jgi:hypothetical protein